jgi:nucleotide-binding universal stress UspA family protein
MAAIHAPRIVVGIDDTPASATGVTYAALEAQRLGAELDIVHATPGYGDLDGDVPLVDAPTLAAFGHKLLGDAEVLARSVAPNLHVRSALRSGGTVATLVSSTQGALMLVLGAERRSFVGRIWTGDVVGGAAARSHCPVVMVAPEWDPSEEHGHIVVGLKTPGEARELLAAGLDLAHECKAGLVVVHAWKLASGYDDIVANRVDSDTYGRRATSVIEPVINELRQAYPEVAVRIEVLHAQPALALVKASADADRLLISRPAHATMSRHLGPVARAVLHEARCPVEILPPPSAATPDHATT